MYGFNGCGFKGNIGADPRVNTDLGVCNLRVAVKMDREDNTEWVDVAIWGVKGKELPDFLAKAGKGDTVVATTGQVTTKIGTDGKKYLNVRCNTWDVTIIPKGTFKKDAGASDDLPF